MESDLPSELEVAVRAAFTRDFPARPLLHLRVRAEESDRWVLAVYTPWDSLKPTPYVLYAVNRQTLLAAQLTGNEAQPYCIPNYK